MEFLSVSWSSLHKESYQLSQRIASDGKKHDLIVAIARGGMTNAQLLSDFLSLSVATFTISSYKDMRRDKLSDISYHVGGSLTGKHILLVDDISDSGKTFVRGVGYLKELGASSITTAAPYVKPWTKHLPDYYVEKTDKWVVLPYEVRETIGSVTSAMKKDGAGKKQIQETLNKLGFDEEFISAYFHHA